MPVLIQQFDVATTANFLNETAANVTRVSTTTAPATTMSSTTHFYDRTNSCGCLNGGTCLAPPGGFTSCECGFGFIGKRCETVQVRFGDTYKDKLSEDTPTHSMTSIIAVVSIAVLFTVVCCFILWRKYKSAQHRRRWVNWQETRRQSKATIEGLTVVDTPSSSSDVTPLSVIRRQSQHAIGYTNAALHVDKCIGNVDSSPGSRCAQTESKSSNKQQPLPTTV